MKLYSNIDDTIAALATPYGKSALAIIRISGNNTLAILSRICKRDSGEYLNNTENRRSYKVDIVSDNEILDESVVLVSHKGRSFTGEDSAEIMTHGSPIVIEKVLSLLIEQGVRQAERGEFTYRAYVNGKINLSSAEAIHALIESKNSYETTQSLRKIKGALSDEIKGARGTLKNMLMILEGEIDFPEDETESFNKEDFKHKIESLISILSVIEKKGETASHLISGIKTIISGKTNAGKSSLFNALLGDEKAIVTEHEGTTRDVLDAEININGISFLLHDTAGIRESENEVEKIGISRSRNMLEKADIILLCFDSSTTISKEEKALYSLVKNKRHICLFTKSDKASASQELKNMCLKSVCLNVSAFNKENIEKLKEVMFKVSAEEESALVSNYVYINKRESKALKEAILSLNACLKSLNEGESEEILASHIRECEKHLRELLGEIAAEEVLNSIFSEFCIGK